MTDEIFRVGRLIVSLLAPLKPSAEPKSLNFGEVVAGQSVEQEIVLKHPGPLGNSSIKINNIKIEGDAAQVFSTDFDSMISLQRGNQTTVKVTFEPTDVGKKQATLSVEYDESNEPLEVSLSGESIRLGVEPKTLDFGKVAVGSTLEKEFILTHLGSEDSNTIEIKEVSGEGNAASAFTTNFEGPVVLAPGQEKTLKVAFTPTSTGDNKATIRAEHTGASDALIVDLLGQCIETPKVTNVAPRDQAWGRSLRPNINATFSEDMNEQTLNDTTFILTEEDSGQRIPAAVIHNSQKNVTLKPVKKLAPSTRYKVTIKGGDNGAKDMFGNQLAEDKVWTFQTRRILPIGWLIIPSIIFLTLVGSVWTIVRDAPTLSTRVIEVTRDLPAQTSITNENVDVTATIFPPDNYLKPPTGYDKPSTAVGRTTTAPLQSGTILTETSALKLPEGWWSLSVPRSSAFSPPAGQKLILLGVEDDSEEVISEEAIALGEKEGQITIALPSEAARKAAPYLLGDSRVLMLRAA